MASMIVSAQIALPARVAKRNAAKPRVVAVKASMQKAPKAAVQVKEKAQALALSAAALSTAVAGPAAAAQELAQVAEVNILGVVATALFILIPTSFLITLFIKSESEGNVSGGFSQEYYEESFKRGDKKAK